MLKTVKTLILSSIVLMFSANIFASGTIKTAADYFKSVSEYYATLKDYEATVDIVADKQEMSGRVSFKRPNLLRIDFTNPQEQVICFNGDMLTIYLPDQNAILQQQVESDGAGSVNLATPQGLALMNRYYVPSYEIGQDPVPFETGSDEMVVKLVLTRRNTSEAFRYIKLAINSETKLIRHIEAVNTKGEILSFSFVDYKINQNITDQRFIYNAPSSANNFNNFLFAE